MGFNLKTALASIAPTLATMLGGPLAGTAVTALEGALGLQAGSGQDGITQVLQTGAMTPETLAAVRAADQRHAEILGQQGIDLQKLNADHEAALATVDAGDRDSARRREIAVRGLTTPALAWLVVLGSLGVTIAVVSGYVTSDPKLSVLVGTVLGSLMSEAKQVLAYYFGSSAGSQAKDAVIADAMKP